MHQVTDDILIFILIKLVGFNTVVKNKLNVIVQGNKISAEIF
jgi:hypothetical protein